MKTFKGEPITLINDEIKVGDKAPNFKGLLTDLTEVELKDFKEDLILLNVVPSLDTLVCNIQTKTLNEEIESLNLDKSIKVITLSNDLPFAQARWAAETNVKNQVFVSDYKDVDFGTKYGLLINELRLLARSFIVIDQKRKVVYKQVAEEQSQHLDFDNLLQFLTK